MEEEKKRISFKEIMLGGMTNFVVLATLMVLFFLIYNFDVIFQVIRTIATILLPVILGVVIAYLLDPLVDRMESLLDKALAKMKLKKHNMRLPAILICILLFVFCVYLLILLVVPAIIDNITNLINQLPGQITALYYDVMRLMENKPQLSQFVYNIYHSSYQNFTNYLTNWVQNDLIDQVSVLITGMVGLMRFLVDAVVSIIVAIYALQSEDTFKRQIKKIIVAFFNDAQTDKIYVLLAECNKIFGGFISGKVIDSLIIGVICFIVSAILGFPYPMLVSVIVGITNVIPFFGPYIGAVPCTILIFLVSPSKGAEFLVFIILLQQFDGNILGPRIIGESVGLSPFWIIFSILLGSGLFGIVGMLIGVPVFGVIYYLAKSFVNHKLSKKGKTEYI